MTTRSSQNGQAPLKKPNQNKGIKGSRLRQESLETDTTALFQHSPESDQLEKEFEAGCLPDEVYDKALPSWRAGLRRMLVASLRVESEYLAKAQVRSIPSPTST
jgi:hypothetical protein